MLLFRVTGVHCSPNFGMVEGMPITPNRELNDPVLISPQQGAYFTMIVGIGA